MPQGRKREYWVDNTKIIACFFVVIWHLYQSFVKSDILVWGDVFEWFNQSVERFHVHLFFICSGYLYQQYTKMNSFGDKGRFTLKKLLELGVPFFVFCTALWALKTIFAGEINNEVGGIVSALFVSPLAPYWYLYCLFIIFLVTPLLKDAKTAVAVISIAVIMQITFIIGGNDITVYAVNALLKYELWFVIGMLMSYLKFSKIKGSLLLGIVTGALFVAVSIAVYVMNINFYGRDLIMGILACTCVISITKYFDNGKQSKIMAFLSKYTMPIYLMHTIFAAAGRSILFKLGIANPVIHIAAGLILGFAGPIIAMEVMKRLKLDILAFPTKYIKLHKKAEIKGDSLGY